MGLDVGSKVRSKLYGDGVVTGVCYWREGCPLEVSFGRKKRYYDLEGHEIGNEDGDLIEEVT